MDKETRDKRFIRKPNFPGGNKAYKDFIYSNLQYPKEALKLKIEGLVIIRYEINHKGKVTTAKVVSSLGHGCDDEAIRIVKLLKFEIPKGPRKLKVKFHKTVRIRFQLPKAIPKPITPNKTNKIQYSITTTTKTDKSTEESNPSRSYHYVITI